MEPSESEELLALLAQQINLLVSRQEAHETFTDALLGTLGKTLPALLDPLQENLLSLAEVRGPEMPDDLREHYHNRIADSVRKIDLLR